MYILDGVVFDRLPQTFFHHDRTVCMISIHVSSTRIGQALQCDVNRQEYSRLLRNYYSWAVHN